MTTTQPEVSIVMSVFNGGPHLAATLESIARQDFSDFELIAINDGSTDDSPKLLDQFARHDARIRVLHQENTGLTRALIRGCSEARGKFIARHDAGDESDPRRLKLQIAALLHNETLGFVSCWTEFTGPAGEFLYVQRGTGVANHPVNILQPYRPRGVIDGPTHHASVMFRRDLYQRVGGYRAQFYFGQDWDLWYRLAEISRFQIIPEPLYRARVTPVSISSIYRDLQERVASLSLEASLCRRQGRSEEGVLASAAGIEPVEASRKARASGLYFIGECLRKNRDPRARRYLREAVKTQPLAWKAWVRLIQAQLSIAHKRSDEGNVRQP